MEQLARTCYRLRKYYLCKHLLEKIGPTHTHTHPDGNGGGQQDLCGYLLLRIVKQSEDNRLCFALGGRNIFDLWRRSLFQIRHL